MDFCRTCAASTGAEQEGRIARDPRGQDRRHHRGRIGIGRALAVELAGKGAKLALSDVDSVGLAETVARCDKKGVKALGYDLDVADRAAVEAHADKVVSEFGGPT